MTPLDRAQFEAKFLTRFFEWLEPENIDRFIELARKKNLSLFELVVVGLRRSFDRPGTTPEEIEEGKALFRQCGLDWDNCL
jgi:hypothetical protein